MRVLHHNALIISAGQVFESISNENKRPSIRVCPCTTRFLVRRRFGFFAIARDAFQNDDAERIDFTRFPEIRIVDGG